MEILEFKKIPFRENEDFNLVYFACRATSRTSAKKIFHYIASDGEKIFGSDGHQLHISKIKLNPGMYYVIKCNKREIQLHYEGIDTAGTVKYPNTQIIIDETLKKIKTIKPINVSFTSFKKVSDYCCIIRNISPGMTKEGRGIDVKYLDNMGMDDWNFFDTKENTVYFENHSKTKSAIIAISRIHEI